MINLKDKHDCCGCTACDSVCHHHAITLSTDEEGFIYPTFDKRKCVECGLCESVCPVIKYKSSPKQGTPETYVAINTNKEQYMNSSSGGIFILLCEYALSQGGIVCGASYDNNFVVRHTFASTLAECASFQGSKYVQSNICHVYAKVRNLLRTGKKVLFSGTPCQVAGLKLFLRKNYENLYTVDLICHGVPSPLIFKDFLDFVKGKSKVISLNMKSKSESYKGTATRIELSNGKHIYRTLKAGVWNTLYSARYMHRPSCHTCQFTHYNRAGDMTIGDSWNVSKYHPGFHPGKNTSTVLINTAKGRFLFGKIKASLDYKAISKNECLQPQLQYPAEAASERDTFWKDYHKHGFHYIAKKYAGYTPIALLKESIKRFL